MAYDDAGGYANQSYVSLATGTYNNLDRSLVPEYVVNGIIYPPFSSGSCKVLYVLPIGGDVTITGVSAAQASSGHTFICVNLGLSSQLIFPHQTGSSVANQFHNMGAGNVSIPACGAARCTYLFPPGASNGFWQFA